ncbi:hypothetical protein K488DRAFT_87538 [Vararia minispora EC-137]|uniref:Uncharacterized protein n=1 Tax=Vararia minispora EC-137 TaxID=1314806 RepID=A0ACB8QGF7_9AGAM|nr:hypothetical protein K488DRAFT_87538 [Vararia minispora EC-137]
MSRSKVLVSHEGPDVAYLPMAILCELFRAIAASDPPKRKRLPAHKRLLGQDYSIHLGWVRLGHVCRNWRINILDHMPWLWAKIICMFPLGVDIVLSRAHGSVLRFLIPYLGDTREDEMHHQMELACTNIVRLDTLEAPHEVTYDWTPALGGRMLPLLIRLQITHDSSVTRGVPLKLHAPSLHHASLWNFFGKIVAPELRYLSLSGTNFIPSPCWELLDVLRGLPLLETLNLQLLLTPAHERAGRWDTYPRTHIHLKYIKALDIEANAFCDLPQFLLRCIIPLRVHFTLESWGGMEVHNRILNTIQPRLAHEMHDGLFLHDFLPGGESARFTIFSCADNDDPCVAPEGVRLELHFSTNGPIDLFNQLRAFTLRLNALTIRRLVFSSVEALETAPGALAAALSAFVGASSVQVHSCTNMLLRALCLPDPLLLIPILPVLAELLIEMEDAAQADAHTFGAWWLELNGALDQRARAGYAVQKLRLVGFWASDEAMFSLMQVDEEGLGVARHRVGELLDERTLEVILTEHAE